MSTLKAFAASERILAASLSGLGAVDRLVVGYYDLSSREYKPRKYEGAIEILNITGNIARREDEVMLHVHVTASRKHEGAVGGHLMEARVSATFEMTLDLLDGSVVRKLDPGFGLPLLDLPRYEIS